MKWAQTKTVPLQGPFPNQWWAMRDVACGFAARFRFGTAALACCAGKRLRVSSAPHPCGFESLCDGRKKKGLHHWRPNKSMVGDEGCPRAAGAARAPLRRSAPRVLRCKTLRVSSAPHPCGFESHALGPKKKGLHHWRPNDSVVGDGGCRLRLRRPLPLRRSAPRVLRWKTLRVSSAPHPCGFESHALRTKKKGLHHWRPNKSMVGDEGFEPPALCV